MPRPTRRNPSRQEQAEGTPTRNPAINPITAPIPPSMLQTPPHAPFVNVSSPNLPPIPQPHFQQSQHHTPLHRAQNHPSTDTTNDTSRHVGRSVSPVSSPTDSQHTNDSNAQSAPLDSPGLSFPALLPGLREISPLATWTLSSSKPGCSLAQLRHPSPTQFWQSDGPQPHTLTLHFFKLVAIVKMRIYLDFELDESYTPTKIRFAAGMSEGGLVEFGGWDAPSEEQGGMESVTGWVDVDLKGVGGRERRKGGVRLGAWGIGEDGEAFSDEEDDGPGDVLKCMVVQVRVCENHQNGKDTHVRGFQVFARDDSSGTGTNNIVRKVGRKTGGGSPKRKRRNAGPDAADGESDQEEMVGIEEADWMGDPEIR